MFDSVSVLIPIGFALFILRAQLMRIGIAELGLENLHASRMLGQVSGWLGLAGAAGLAVVAFVHAGAIWGLALVTGGMALGIVVSALTLPLLRSTFALGHHSGDGDRSVAEFNRLYGPYVALAVAGIAIFCAFIAFQALSSIRF
jgi:hypothetical protein